MKRLFVIRHAKSSWDYPELKDIDRPLNSRGIRDAPRIGEYLKNKGYKPELYISSPAVRAKSTCDTISNHIEGTKEIVIKDELFHASVSEIVLIVKNIGDANSAAIFGHNPGFTSFVNFITGSQIYNIPTCGVAVVDFEISDWHKINTTKGKLVDYIYPKGL